ncbi:hypothetical protein ECFRIK1985_5227, partial [Escherichia coli FRIK1985]
LSLSLYIASKKGLVLTKTSGFNLATINPPACNIELFEKQ